MNSHNDDQQRRAGEREISAAIAEHLELMWNDEMKRKIVAEVGEAGLARVREIQAFAERPEFWTTGTTDQGYRRIKTELREKYSFLSPEAIERLATRAAWSWK